MKMAGVGEIEGDGEESLVKGGELEVVLSVPDDGLRVLMGNGDACSTWSYAVMLVDNAG